MDPQSPALPALWLTQGAQGPAVAEVRDRLTRLGLLASQGLSSSGKSNAARVHDVPVALALDQFDNEVADAVRTFQQERGITVDGIVGSVTFRRLEEARWNLGDRVISFSPGHLNAGDDVAQLQRRLNSLGFDAGRVDGIFGTGTDHALREFQRNVGIAVDGTCGPQVWRALERLIRTVSGGAGHHLRQAHQHTLSRTGVADKVIVIDPGHGGPDHGTVGHRLAESIIADDLSQRIEGRLAAIGTQVLISRPTSYDMNQALDEAARAQFANDNGADLVVSLHTDSEPTGRAHGAATFFYGHSNDHSVLGQRFAEIVQHEIVCSTDLADGRVHGKTWDLLRLTQMPTVRIECGYVSNRHDADRLSDATFRDALAQAISSAIVKYFAPD